MTYEKSQKKKSDFTTDDLITNASTLDYVKEGVNKKTSWSNLLDKIGDVYGASLRVFDTESELVASDIRIGEHAIVVENGYTLYSIGNLAASTGDVTLTSGYVATFRDRHQTEYDDYTELRGLKSSAIPDGAVIKITNDGIAGDFVAKTGANTDNGGTIIQAGDDVNRYYERDVDGNVILLSWFGLTTAGFRSFWDYLRDEWFTNSQQRVGIINGDVTITSPTEDRAGVAAFVMDFSGEVKSQYGAKITCTALSNTTMCLFQIGTFTSRLEGPKGFKDIEIDCSDACSGVTFADTFQGRLWIDTIKVSNTDGAGQYSYRTCNVQELWAKNLVSFDAETGFLDDDATSGSARAEGSNGSYSTSTAASFNNNNKIQLICQNASTYGIRIKGGEQNIFEGLVQGGFAWTAGIKVEGGNELKFKDMWVETSNPAHNEVVVDNTFTGNIEFENLHGGTTGAEIDIAGGELITFKGGDWQGRIDVTSDTTKVIYDRNPGVTIVAPRVANLNELCSIGDYTAEQSSKFIPYNTQYFDKRTIPASTTEVLHQFGNDATSNTSKGGWGRVMVRNDTTGSQVMIEFDFVGSTNSIVDKVGTQAAVGCTLTTDVVGSSPVNIARVVLQNANGSDSISSELVMFKNIF